MNIDDIDVCKIIEEVHRRDKSGNEFNIGTVSDCDYDKDSNENKEESSGEINNEEGHEL